MSKQVRADGILLLVTLCWGVSYLLMDISLTDLDPFTLNSFRFLGAFAIAAVVSWKRVKTVNRQTLKYSLIVGLRLWWCISEPLSASNTHPFPIRDFYVR